MDLIKFVAQVLVMIVSVFTGHGIMDQKDPVQDWVIANAKEIEYVEMDSPAHDLQALASIIGDATVVCLGESRHDAREQFLLKNRFVKYMVEELGFTNFILEASMPYAELINDYVLGRGGDIDKLMAGMPGWFLWDTEEMKELILWMREHNEKPDTHEKVRFYGIDIVAPDYSLTQIFDFLARVDEEKLSLFPDSSFSREIIQDDYWPGTREAYSGMTDDRKKILKENYSMLFKLLEQNKEHYISAFSVAEYNWVMRMAYCAREANLMYSAESNLEFGLRRDAAMAENVLWIQNDLSENRKSIVWAHNVHIAKDWFTMSIMEESTIRGMGFLMKKELGDSMVSIGASFNRGEYPEWGKSFSPADQNSLDGALAQAEIEIFLLPLNDVQTLEKSHLYFSVEQTLRAQGFDMNCIPEKCFDAFYFVENITHTIPSEQSAVRYREMR